MTKRMNMETKKRLALEFLHQSGSVFSPKELPNEWHKHKGISKGACEKVINELEYDGSIHLEKIGASKYVWSFKSEQANEKKKKLKKLEQELIKIEEDIKKTENALKIAQDERKDPDREKILEKLPVLRERNEQNKKKIDDFKGCDATTFKTYIDAVQVAKDAAERHTDNIYALIKIVKEKKCMRESEVLAAFGLPADFDYIE